MSILPRILLPLVVASMISCCQVTLDQLVLRPPSQSSIQKELVEIDRLIQKARRENRQLDVDTAHIMQAALLVDLAAVDTPRQEQLLKKAEELNLGGMENDGNWYSMFCILHQEARIAELRGKLDVARSIYKDAADLLEETESELVARGATDRRELRPASHRLLMRVCRDLVRARMAVLCK